MTDFKDLGLAEPVLRALSTEGYTAPTPIQNDAIPVMLAGRDLVGIAQTGTGKTAAFTLPLLDRLAADRAAGEKGPAPRTCGALVLAPTRELAAQIADSIRAYGRHLRPAVAVIVGGVKPGPQVKQMARGADIVVATPGRLLDHMSTGAVRLDATRAVVLDEADQMLDLGFVPAIRKIMAKLPKARQTVLFSATMPPPIRTLAADFLTDPAEVSVAPVSRPIERIAQRVRHTAAGAKREALIDLVGAAGVDRAIVFTRTKRGADRVAKHLTQAGHEAAAIHGNKSQNQRTRVLEDFKRSKVTLLVATDIAARGIDVDDVSHVVNFDLPNVPEAYVHRIGRTARAGKSGTAVSLCEPEEIKLLRDIERLIGFPIDAEGDVPPEGRGGRPRGAAPGKARNRGQDRGPDRGQDRGQSRGGKAEGGGGDRPSETRGKPRRQKRRAPPTERTGPDRSPADVTRPEKARANKPEARPSAKTAGGGAKPAAEAPAAGLTRMLAGIGSAPASEPASRPDTPRRQRRRA